MKTMIFAAALALAGGAAAAEPDINIAPDGTFYMERCELFEDAVPITELEGAANAAYLDFGFCVAKKGEGFLPHLCNEKHGCFVPRRSKISMPPVGESGLREVQFFMNYVNANEREWVEVYIAPNSNLVGGTAAARELNTIELLDLKQL